MRLMGAGRVRQRLLLLLGLVVFGYGCATAQRGGEPAMRGTAPAAAVASADNRAEKEEGKAEAYYRFMRSLLAAQTGDYQTAITWQKAALGVDPRSVVLHNHLASLYMKRGDVRGAISAAEDVLALDARNLHAHQIGRAH